MDRIIFFGFWEVGDALMSAKDKEPGPNWLLGSEFPNVCHTTDGYDRFDCTSNGPISLFYRPLAGHATFI